MNTDFVVSAQSNDYQNFTSVNFLHIIRENPCPILIRLSSAAIFKLPSRKRGWGAKGSNLS